MSWYTDWFLADEAEAGAIASIGSDDDDGHSFEDWPHLAMKSIGEMELMRLWGVLRGDSERMDDVSGGSLFVAGGEEEDEEAEGGTVVSRVDADFLAALAALSEPEIDRVAGAWHGCEEMAEWEAETVSWRLREMVEFARRAGREGKPILQLNVW
jgi:hypothetical protein